MSALRVMETQMETAGPLGGLRREGGSWALKAGPG